MARESLPDPERVSDVVRVALREPGAALGEWHAAPLGGEFGALAGGSRVYRLSGVARVGVVERSWDVVLKVIRPGAGSDDPSHIRYRKRELLLYRSGLLDELPDGLGAPRCFGSEELADGTSRIWLEYVRESQDHAWSLDRWALAARHLGRVNGAYLVGRRLPDAPWLKGRRLGSWLDGHVPLVARIAAAPDNPELRQWWPRPVVDSILRLWDERDAFLEALERLPRTFGHGDAIRRNLRSRRRGGVEETVAIDWEHAGAYAAGEEVGQTLSVASAFFDLDPSSLPALDEALFDGYLAGLGDAGWRGDPRPVRFAYTAHAALRNAFNAVGASVPDAARRSAIPRDLGHSWEELAERRAAIRPFLLERANEARAWSRSR